MNAEDLVRQAEQALAQDRFEVALPLLRQAADAGHGGACLRLAQYLLHFEPQSRGEEALQRLSQSRSLGHAAGFYLSACVALGGRLLQVAPTDVAQWLLEAARRGMSAARRAVFWVMACARADRLEPSWLQADQLPDVEQLAARLREGLQALPQALHHHAPRVAVVQDLLSEPECRLLMQVAASRLRPSTVHDPLAAATWRDPLRSSSDWSLDPLEEDFILRWVQARMAVAAGCPLVQAEHLVVLHYARGEQYKPHRDDLGAAALQRHRPEAGQRWRTLCVYLNEVEQGGQTEFPLLGVAVQPRPGSAVIFDNLDANGQAEPRSLHAGRPVLAGQKWLATLWWRQRDYRAW